MRRFMISSHLMVFMLSSALLAVPEWVLNVNLQHGTMTTPLYIGGDPAGTNAFDKDLDKLSPPAPPGTDDYFAYLEIVDPVFTQLTKDIRGWASPYSASIEWKIVISNSGGAQTTFSWDTQDVPSQGFFTLVASNTVNMRSAGTATFTGNGIVYIRYRLQQSRSFTLAQGWNMVSINVVPENPALATMLSEIVSSLVIMKNGQGQVYWPALGINTIGNWNPLHGYQIYMQSAATLNVTGTDIVPETTPISLNQGWNLGAYLRNGPLSMETALGGIVSKLTIAKNGGGQVYWPALGINTIGSMQVGQGYQMYMTQATTLTYPAN